jgi:hypothetical protein
MSSESQLPAGLCTHPLGGREGMQKEQDIVVVLLSVVPQSVEK